MQYRTPDEKNEVSSKDQKGKDQKRTFAKKSKLNLIKLSNQLPIYRKYRGQRSR